MFRSRFLVSPRVGRLHLTFSTKSYDIKKVGIVGLGLMGHGIAQITAQAGYKVLAIETNQEAIDRGMKRIEGSLSKVLSKDVQKGKLSEADAKKAQSEIMSRFTTTTQLTDAKDCDLVIEAIAENMDLKLNFYKTIGPIVKPTAILASNTSSLPITEMGVVSGRPEQFVGVHFFNPVQIMKLVEIVQTEKSSPEVVDAVTKFGRAIGKTTVTCKDKPGFIVNRLLVPYISQALAMLDRGEASIADIDSAMQLGAGHPMGPLQLADYIGLDTLHHILVGWTQNYPNEPAFFVPECLDQLVSQGNFGRKTGQGFYTWEGDKIKST